MFNLSMQPIKMTNVCFTITLEDFTMSRIFGSVCRFFSTRTKVTAHKWYVPCHLFFPLENWSDQTVYLPVVLLHIIRAVMLSKLGNCNSLLYGLSHAGTTSSACSEHSSQDRPSHKSQATSLQFYNSFSGCQSRIVYEFKASAYYLERSSWSYSSSLLSTTKNLRNN